MYTLQKEDPAVPLVSSSYVADGGKRILWSGSYMSTFLQTHSSSPELITWKYVIHTAAENLSHVWRSPLLASFIHPVQKNSWSKRVFSSMRLKQLALLSLCIVTVKPTFTRILIHAVNVFLLLFITPARNSWLISPSLPLFPSPQPWFTSFLLFLSLFVLLCGWISLEESKRCPL